MALPLSRNTTYGAASPVFSNDLNALEDCIIGGKRGSYRRSFAPIPINGAIGSSWQFASVGVSSTASGVIKLFVPTENGDRVTGLEIRALGNGTVDATIDLNLIATDGTSTSKGNLVDNNRAGGSFSTAVVPVTAYTLLQDERLEVSINANATGYQVATLSLILYHP